MTVPLLVQLVGGLLVGGCLLLTIARLLPRSVAIAAGLLLLFPSLFGAFFLPGAGEGHGGRFIVQGMLLSLAVIFPVGRVLLQHRPNFERIAQGLGADKVAALKLVWRPLLLRPCLASACLAGGLVWCCLLVDGQ